jgi:hypothetical protein
MIRFFYILFGNICILIFNKAVIKAIQMTICDLSFFIPCKKQLIRALPDC